MIDIFGKKKEKENESEGDEEGKIEKIENEITKAEENIDNYKDAHKHLSEAYYTADENELSLPPKYEKLSKRVLEKAKGFLLEDIENCRQNELNYFAKSARYNLKRAYETLGKNPPEIEKLLDEK